MKLKVISALLALGALLPACDNEPAQPVRTPVIVPARLEQDDYKRELVFDEGNRLTRIKNSSYMPNDVVLESTMEFFYGPDGKSEKAINDGGYRLEYTWEDGKIVRSDQYINDVFTQYYTFSYDERGRVREYSTWQDIPEEGGEIPVAKEVYIYDGRDNTTNQFLYYYDSGIKGHRLLTAFEFSDYDDKIATENLFDGYSFNPTAVFRKNNPGKMVTKNASGMTGLIDEYTYVYNSHGYATRKTTTSVFSYNGSGGSYNTYYYFAER